MSLLLAPLVFGCVHTAVLGAGERWWPRPTGAVRIASLTPRSLPSSTRWLRAACTAATVAVVVTGVRTGRATGLTDDDLLTALRGALLR